MDSFSDELLVAEYLNGNASALEILIQHYVKPVYHFAYRYTEDAADAEDVTQEAFIKAWKNLKRFNLKRRFKTWIFEITKNTAIDFLRKKKPLVFSQMENSKEGDSLIDSIPDPAPLLSESMEEILQAGNIATILENLSHAHRMVVILHYHEELTLEEISHVLGDPINTIKSRHRRALLALRNHLKSQ